MLRNDAPFRPLARAVRVRHRLFGAFFCSGSKGLLREHQKEQQTHRRWDVRRATGGEDNETAQVLSIGTARTGSKKE